MNIVLHITLFSGKVHLSANLPAPGGYAFMSTVLGTGEDRVEASGRVNAPSTIATMIPLDANQRVFWVEFMPI